MFKIEDQPKLVEWPVSVNVPQDGGKIKKNTFTAEFELITQEELDAIYKDGGTDVDLLRQVLFNCTGVCDAEGKPIDFNDDLRDKLINIPYVRSALVAAYVECSHGKAAARKN
ncbi:hypothetical protein [Nitrosomonas sp. Nm34]|uniref:hypothetical protein n=1 Tax=Nitrosomonas sp. Nm34 TaxID=1881055 RepID=UPI0008F17812|nr:hypothetical protein [Nitrosomonas sp. Nm34]SFJ04226.1 hypothetical protein SAMN05428978_10882 [Nitrosomonas sp. Nm34]